MNFSRCTHSLLRFSRPPGIKKSPAAVIGFRRGEWERKPPEGDFLKIERRKDLLTIAHRKVVGALLERLFFTGGVV